jgi:nanoRNase/pAp phosphatase (c-di-AMP/oligoRNAs hydrolase)
VPVTNNKSSEKVSKLVELLRGKRSLLIVMQDNPDPDSIASAAALRRIANTLSEVQCSIAYGGVIGRGENRAVAGYLGLNFRSIEEIDLDKYDAVALVDTQPKAGNNSLPEERVPDIVLDHHPLRSDTRGVRFSDVRKRYGAVSTMLVEYLGELGITPDPPLATALLYAIRSDTHDLGTEAVQADIDAAEALYPLVNTRMLSAIQRGRVPRGYYSTLARALDNARLYGSSIVADLGDVDNPDMMGETADLFLRHEGVEWVVCFGAHEGKLLLSLRTSQSRKRAGDVMKRIVSRIGTGGGHATAAGGQVPLKKGTRSEREQRHKTIRDRLLREAGESNGRGRKLLGTA